MIDHTVEMQDGSWLLLSRSVPANSPLHAVIRTAKLEGTYRARSSDQALSTSEYFLVPGWGQPSRIAGAG